MDILSSEIHKEQDLKMWLEQLQDHRSPEDKQGAIHKSQDILQDTKLEFDSILGELDNLEKQFDVENKSEQTHQLRNENISMKSHALSDVTLSTDGLQLSQALEEFSFINSQLEDVLNDLAGFVHNPPPSANVTNSIIKETNKGKPPPPPVPTKHRTSVSSIASPFLDTQTKIVGAACENLQNGSEVRRSASRSDEFLTKSLNVNIEAPKFEHVQACVSVYTPDGSVKCVYITNKTTVADLCNTMVHEHVIASQTSFTLWEVLSELSMERQLYDAMLILNDVVDYWSKHSTSKIVIKTNQSKPFTTNLKSDLEGTLHVKVEDKKSWKSYLFIMKQNGMFYYPKGKGKSGPSCYLELNSQMDLDVFSAIGWKKKLKAPTEHGFALKNPKIQMESSKEIKYFSTDSEALQMIWITSTKELLQKKTLPTIYKEPVFDKISQSHYSDDSNHYSEPFETPHHPPVRRLSNVTSQFRSDQEESIVSPSIKKTAVLPITTETTRYLKSMQATLPQKSLPKSTSHDFNQSIIQKEQHLNEKNQRNQPCFNEYTPSPVACKSADILSKFPLPKGNIIKTLPKPNKALCQQNMTAVPVGFDLDLPPPPPSLMNQHMQYQTLPAKSRTLPPPLPKRDQSTKLSSRPVDALSASIQTRNFILNLDRTIGQKKIYGAEGINRVEMPLPPPLVASEEMSYIDLGELPPPPAELLQGLRCMKVNPMFFQPFRRWP